MASINNEEDAAKSAQACLPDLKQKLADYDAFLVCCYSQHPLVPQLRTALLNAKLDKPVTGIFEASVSTCLQAINATERFGIVSTGSQWEEVLGDAVTVMLGAKFSDRYAGCKTTGLNADELHTAPQEEVEKKMMEATKRLVGAEAGAKAICLGCAGMAGMNEIVRKACIEELGQERGRQVKIVDGVVAGAACLEGALRARF